MNTSLVPKLYLGTSPVGEVILRPSALSLWSVVRCNGVAETRRQGKFLTAQLPGVLPRLPMTELFEVTVYLAFSGATS